jgi:hypothetical protein
MKDTSDKTKNGFRIFDIIFITVIIILIGIVAVKMLGVTFPGVGRDQSVSESLGSPRGSEIGGGSHILSRDQSVSEFLGSPRGSHTSGGSHWTGR